MADGLAIGGSQRSCRGLGRSQELHLRVRADRRAADPAGLARAQFTIAWTKLAAAAPPPAVGIRCGTELSPGRAEREREGGGSLPVSF